MELKKISIPVGRAGSMPGTTGFTMACFEAEKVKEGESLYTEQQILQERSIASELLDACLAMIEWDDREKDHAVSFEARMGLCEQAFEKARAAVAKATGEQE